MIVGTAGHIDHGKSALIEALTGQPMDPWAEERRRGITIDLHFTVLIQAGGEPVGVVDVPGHEDLVRAMVAGAAGIDLVLLVIAADEGIMPQTREHLAVVEQLRIGAGIPVIAKSDLVSPERLAVVEAEVAEWLRSCRVAFSAPIATSIRTGAGLDMLRTRIREWSASGSSLSRPDRSSDDLPRLAIDRAFSLPGVGTVVTGTAWSGTFRQGDQLRILPGGERVRVRSLERHGQAITASRPSERLAVALAGIECDRLGRGQVLVRDTDPWEVTRVLDARLELIPDALRPLSHQTRVRVHLGTTEVLARLSLRAPIAPGESGNVRLVLESPMVARGGDRLVLRGISPTAVIGGGRVLDPLPPPGRPSWPEGLASEAAHQRLAALFSRRPRGIALLQLPVLLGVPPSEIPSLIAGMPLDLVRGTLVERDRVVEVAEIARSAVHAHQLARPDDVGMSLETLRQRLRRYGVAGESALDRLVAQRALVVEEGVIHEPGFEPASGSAALLERVVALVEAGGLSPQSVAELEEALGQGRLTEPLRLAARNGRLVAVTRDRYFGRRALDGFVATVSEIARRGPITPGALRDATGASRKYLIPLLEWADRTGLTIRQGEGRVPGPALRTATHRET